MNQLVIRNLDDAIVQRLKQLAWQAGRTPEDMARHLLVDAITSRALRRAMCDLDLQAKIQ